jgi:glycosyltransferase involved in cell wall biosynthesis
LRSKRLAASVEVPESVTPVAKLHDADTAGPAAEIDRSPRPSYIRRLLILVPCRNEEASLDSLLERLRAALPALIHPSPSHARAVEVCLLDDASTDATWAAMQALTKGDPTITPRQAPRHLGIGGALRYVLPTTDAEVIAMIDADGTYAPEELARLLEAIEAGADIATGSPYHPDGRVDGVPEWRLVISRTLSRIYRAAGHGRFHTYTSMLRAYRRSALEAVRFTSDGFLSTAEILIEAHRLGLVVVEVPVTLSSRRAGRSKMRIAQVILAHVRYLFRLAFGRRHVTPGPPNGV